MFALTVLEPPARRRDTLIVETLAFPVEALLNSEKVGGKDATAFYAAGSKVADSELLDGKNSTEFAGANHNHDSSYIQQSPTSAESASININGTLRTSGMLCTGSETGTSDGPCKGLATIDDACGRYNGLVVRRAVSNPMNAGNVVARTDRLTLERDGTMGGLRVASSGPMAEPAIACMGLTKDGTSVGKYSLLESTIPNPFQVCTDSQNVVYYSCSFGELGSAGHVTEVTMVRQQGVKARGTVTSSVNQ